MVKLLLADQLDQVSPYVEERILNHIKFGQANKFECHEKMSLLNFDWYHFPRLSGGPDGIMILFTQEYLFILCKEEACQERVRKLIHEEPSDARALYVFFAELLKNDIGYLEEMEERITETEDQLLTTSRPAHIGNIIHYRRELLRLKKYYEQLNEIFEGLTENENDMISPEELRYFRILDAKVDRLFDHVLNLRDYVTQVREAYQAQIDIEQNALMRIFTVITGVFLPLTLIVGWYGMNLQMPEYSWKYGYLFVAALSVLVAVACIVLFRRRKWL
jgi:magnesium transporter